MKDKATANDKDAIEDWSVARPCFDQVRNRVRMTVGQTEVNLQVEQSFRTLELPSTT